MTEEVWMNLKVGDSVINLNTDNRFCLVVDEIHEDERSLSKWREKSFPEAKRLIKFIKLGDIYHTWDANHNNWTKETLDIV
jgi:hypothetical protein